jgi:hypothetical protein
MFFLNSSGLFFVGDVMLFTKPNEQNFTVISDVLTLLGNAIALKTNLNKSSIFPILRENTDLIPFS